MSFNYTLMTEKRIASIFFEIPPEYNFWKKAGVYIVSVFLEETIYRFLLLGLFSVLLGVGWAIMITTLIFALSHLLMFKWEMVIVAFCLGLILSAIYTQYSGIVGERVGYLFCVLIHFCVGMVGYLAGFMDDWIRKEV